MEEEATLKRNLARFLPGALAEQALSGEIDLDLGGRTYQATILFSDIIGFTSMSERLSPEQVVRLMNSYFERMVPCILSSGGSVDKFIGDAIMGVWGVPIDKGSATADALSAALAMQSALAGFNSQLPEGDPHLHMGIGLNAGTVVAGNVGSEEQKNYTVLGDTVNTAQRIESASGSDQILISQKIWDICAGAVAGIAMPPLRVKNKSEPLRVFSVRGLRTIHGETVLHLPLRCGDHRVWLIRQLVDKTVVIIHPAMCDICAHPLVTDVVEWADVPFGRVEMVAVLPRQTTDGKLVRSQVRLADPLLGGLLTDQPIICRREWDQMARASAG
jgi:class 3 adenylate cyclase